MNDVSFRDWRRTETLNRDQTDGFLDNGKRCVHTFPWQEDPAIDEQGSWSLSSCATPRAFVCQHAAETRNIAMTVTGKAIFSGSAEVYGGFLSFNAADILELKTSHASEVVIDPTVNPLGRDSVTSANVIKTMIMEDGSILRLEGQRQFNGTGGVFVGERYLHGLQPVLKIGRGVRFKFLTEAENTLTHSNVSARIESTDGSILVGTGVSVDFGQVNILPQRVQLI